MKSKIINILKEIEMVEDKDEVVFPLIFKLSELYNENENKFRNLMLSDKDIHKIILKKKNGVEVVYFIDGKITDNPKWKDYRKKENGK